MFFAGSRYQDLATDSIGLADGRVVRFLKTRFIPDTPAQAAVVVNGDERLDHVAQRVYQDPQAFWRICDANAALWPPDLVAEPGRLLGVAPAEG